MPITEEDVLRVQRYVDKNSFYVKIDQYAGNPEDLVGKDLFVLACEQVDHPIYTIYRLKVIERKPER